MLRSLKTDVLGLLQKTYQKYNQDGIFGVITSMPSFIRHRTQPSLEKTATWLVSRTDIGKNWYEEEFDLLVILDTCRIDSMEKASENYDFISDISETLSKGGQSAEWMANTFTESWKNKVENTALITSNPHATTVFEQRLNNTFNDKPNPTIDYLKEYGTRNFVSDDDFGHYQTFWQKEGEHGQRAPRHVTDHAIKLSRESDFDRMVVHYMPPHAPYVTEAKEANRDLKEYEADPFNYIRETGNSERVFESHVKDLEWILEEVELLLNNIDADSVIVTSDHGDGFGEYGMYRHRPGHLSPKVRIVPYVETSAADSGSYEPNLTGKPSLERSQKEALEALGYM